MEPSTVSELDLWKRLHVFVLSFIRVIAKDKLWNFIHLCAFSPPPPAALAFASGLAATVNITHLLKGGEGVVCMDDVYGGETPSWEMCSHATDHQLGWLGLFAYVVKSPTVSRLDGAHGVFSFLKRHKPLLPKNRSWSWSGCHSSWLHKAGAAEGCSETQHQGRSRKPMIRMKNKVLCCLFWSLVATSVIDCVFFSFC